MAGILFGADGAGLKSEIQIIRMKQSKHGTGGALMAEYIEREALLKELAKDVAVDGNQRAAQILECIINAPAADVAPVDYGRDDLYVYDKDTGHTHRVGDDQHDCLYVSSGVVYYYNLQNGCGTLPDGSGTYEFVDSDCGWIDGGEEDA